WNTDRNNLVALIGLDPVNEYTFDSTSLPSNITELDQQVFRQKIGDIKSAANRALDARPDVVAERNTVGASESQITSAHSGYFPTVSASWGYSWRNNELDYFGSL